MLSIVQGIEGGLDAGTWYIRRKARRDGPWSHDVTACSSRTCIVSQSVCIPIREARMVMLTRVATPEPAQHAPAPAASSKHRRSRALSGSRRLALLLNGSLRAGCLFTDMSIEDDLDMRVRDHRGSRIV